MNKIKNILLAGVALMGLGIGTASADPIGVDPADYDIDLSISNVVNNSTCEDADAGDCSDLDFTSGSLSFYSLLGGANNGDVGTASFSLSGEATDGSTLAGALTFTSAGGTGASILFLDLTNMGSNGSIFDFTGSLISGSGAIYNDFVAAGAGTFVGIVYTQGFIDIVAGPTSVPEPSTLFLLGAGLVGLGLGRRRSKA